MVLCSDRMVQLLLPTSWLSQARGWYVQFQLRLAIDPISLVTQSCILLTALAAGGYASTSVVPFGGSSNEDGCCSTVGGCSNVGPRWLLLFSRRAHATPE